MPNYRRRYVRGATYFFTAVTYGRRPILCSELARPLLRQAIEATRSRWPFEIDAWVLLPDHLHTMWTLPHGDADYSRRWAFLKKEFSKAYLAAGGEEGERSVGQVRSRYRAVWQARFWEHTIRDSDDYERHFHYLHYNPVRHGLVERVADYQHSTFHRHVASGLYPHNWPDWAADTVAERFKDLNITGIEMGE